jgi:DNA uptake protein ComE-like DNA-binding protein
MRKIDINTAGLDEMAALKGVGRIRAAALASHRPFGSWDMVERVDGFDRGIIDEMQRDGATLGDYGERYPSDTPVHA